MGRLGIKLNGFWLKNVTAFFRPDFTLVYCDYLRKLGMRIEGNPDNIDRSAYFDPSDYSLISIGAHVVISREVMILTHDYSITNALRIIDKPYWGESRHSANGGAACFLKPVSIGENSFIGARVSLLPGTTIGKNCIIGSCSVVKGNIPEDSIVVGNPAKVVCKTSEWAQKKFDLGEYIFN